MAADKPGDSRWTDEQWQAISESGHDLLVAAAAGSGKTAVLVERIIQKITDPQHPIPIDDLLVVTFTKAAAAEMKERIGAALNRQLAVHPESPLLRRQQALLGKAPIMTLHAFCMSVIKRYYYFLDLDPGFRLLDETEAALMREEILDQLMEAYYGADRPDAFNLLVDRYSGDRSDEQLRDLILKLYDFSLSHPWPGHWLDRLALAYHVDPDTEIDDFPWMQALKQAVRNKISDWIKALQEADMLCGLPDGPEPYRPTIKKDIAGLERIRLLTAGDWEALRSAFLLFSFDKLKPIRDKTIDGDLKDEAKKMRDQVKKKFTDMKEQWFGQSGDEALKAIADMSGSVHLLRELTGEFAKRYKSAKRKKGLLDFADLEHDCLAILRREDSVPGEEHPSVAAEQYRARFEEILIDEYQDTNRVQEAILSLISKNDPDAGNRFMVGDVKQSIYGFRLAEPALFLDKYRSFAKTDKEAQKIDLFRNFRSRHEIISAINFIFYQIMDEAIGGIDYDQSAALRYGATYPDADRPVELELIDRANQEEEESGPSLDDVLPAETEAHAIAGRIRQMIGDGEKPAFHVYDRGLKRMRPVRYRDMAVLMRSAGTSAAAVIDILRQYGIPAYADLSSGYFDTVEVTVMLSVLQIIDNPQQDIPLAAVLRSPIVGLDEDELAAIRIAYKKVPFYRAVRLYAECGSDHDGDQEMRASAVHRKKLIDKLRHFLKKLSRWRLLSRSQSVSSLIWQIYRETDYFDLVGGRSGGTQRQANLKALYDRARQYEKTSFRGLFRFLRFIERMRSSGGDLGEARALSQQQDVVHVMTIHKSKGLEFPVVFVAGMDRKFNLKDSTSVALLHKSLGFGTRWIDPDRRLSVPTLPYLVIGEQMKSEAIAEEMRILYVALTRAREKLILVASVPDVLKKAKRWFPALHARQRLLPDYERAAASSFLDWVGPCIIRHRSAGALHHLLDGVPIRAALPGDDAPWSVNVVPAAQIVSREMPVQRREEAERFERLKKQQPLGIRSALRDEVARRLEWRYPHSAAAKRMAKQTVTELKLQQEYFNGGQDDRLLTDAVPEIGEERPRFLQTGRLSATERGTAVHIFMQHVNLSDRLDADSLLEQSEQMVEREILTREQKESLDGRALALFFQSEVGLKMRRADRVMRECPFSLALDAGQVYSDFPGKTGDTMEKVLVQGVIDCIIEDGEGITLLDYKTDRLSSRNLDETKARQVLVHRYRRQLELYRMAIETTWRRPVSLVGLYAFDGGYFVRL